MGPFDSDIINGASDKGVHLLCDVVFGSGSINYMVSRNMSI